MGEGGKREVLWCDADGREEILLSEYEGKKKFIT